MLVVEANREIVHVCVPGCDQLPRLYSRVAPKRRIETHSSAHCLTDVMLSMLDVELLLSNSLDGKWGKCPPPIDIQINQSAGKCGGDQVLIKFSAAALAEAGADGLPPHYLRIRILANKLAGVFDDLEIDLDLWGTGSGKS